MKNEQTHGPLPVLKTDLVAITVFPHDGRTEDTTEITNEDHSQTFCYAVPEYAEQIVTACNNHDALIEALESLMSLCVTEDGLHGQQEEWEEMVHARNLLATIKD